MTDSPPIVAGDISAVGYTVSLTVVFVFVALVIGLALAVLFWLTIGLSTLRSVKQTRRERVRENLQGQLLDRTFGPEADWRKWVDGLSGTERDIAESLLDEYLRELDGQEGRRLQELGTALGIPERSKRQLQDGGEYARLQALTWLTLLEQPNEIGDFEPHTARERALVARCRYESSPGVEHAELLAWLLTGASSQFTIFGQDTLYRIATRAPDTLHRQAKADFRSWSPALLVQVLTVCQHLGSATATDISWLTVAAEHDDEAVRAAAALSLGRVGWRDDIRDGRLLRRMAHDASPRVRGAVYEMLAQLDNQRALDVLVEALGRETHERARLAGTNALVKHQHSLADPTIEDWATAWRWSKEQAAYDRAARATEGT